MGDLLIPGLDTATLTQLQAAAASHGRDEAEEARRILERHLSSNPQGAADAAGPTLASEMRAIFEPLGGHEFPYLGDAGERPPAYSDLDFDD